MIDHGLAVEHIRKRRKVVIGTFLFLLLAFIESWFISCVREHSPVFCPLSWVYVALACVVIFVLFHYRR